MCLSTACFTEVGTVLDCPPAVHLRPSNPLFAYRTYASDSQRKGVPGSDVPQLPRPTGQSRVLTSRWSDRERAACARL